MSIFKFEYQHLINLIYYGKIQTIIYEGVGVRVVKGDGL